MRAAGVGGVEQVGVAGAQGAAVTFEHGLHRGAHRAQMHRQVRGVGDEVSAPVEHGAAEVQTLLDVHRAGRVDQGRAHLLGDRHEEVVEDLEQQRRALRRVGRGRSRRRAAPQQQLAGGQHLGLPARLEHGRARGLADDRRPGEARAARQERRARTRARRARRPSCTGARVRAGRRGRAGAGVSARITRAVPSSVVAAARGRAHGSAFVVRRRRRPRRRPARSPPRTGRRSRGRGRA